MKYALLILLPVSMVGVVLCFGLLAWKIMGNRYP